MTSILRIIRFGFKNYFRNIWLSIAATSVMLLTIFIISILIISNWVGGMAIDVVKEKIDVSVYLESDVAESQVNQIKNKLLSLQEVKSIDYISKEEALRDFQSQHEENQMIASSISELNENPLQPTLIVKARYPEDYQVIVDNINIDEYENIISSVNFEDNKAIIERLTSITSGLKRVGWILSIIFGFVAILVIANTVRLTIYTQREEIRIMKLVGATNNFIRSPYIIEGIMYGVFGSILSFVILYPVVKYSSPLINNFMENQGIDILAYFTEHALSIIAFEILIGIILGIISSFWAIRRYLRV